MALRLYSWFTLAWTILTIVVGAIVRATTSGDGCGKSWPSCDGSFMVTSTHDVSRAIEFSHRFVSGVNLLAVVVLVVLALRLLPSGHPARRSAPWVLVSILVEAGLGAIIVLYGWVAHDTSVARQITVPVHLVNTLVLTGVMSLTVWQINGGGQLSLVDGRRVRSLALIATLIAPVAATSLADTLYPAHTLEGGVSADFDAASAVIVRFRILHPVFAIAAGIAVIGYVWRHFGDVVGGGRGPAASAVLICVLAQIGLGFVHVVLLTPIGTALAHLALAQTLWVCYAFYAFGRLRAAPSTSGPLRAPAPTR